MSELQRPILRDMRRGVPRILEGLLCLCILVGFAIMVYSERSGAAALSVLWAGVLGAVAAGVILIDIFGFLAIGYGAARYLRKGRRLKWAKFLPYVLLLLI